MEFFHLVTALLKQEANLELVRLAIVYMHLIACCVAVGLVVTSDLAMARQLLRGDDSAHCRPSHLESLQRTISLALLVLWVTGAAIILLDMSVKGWTYLLNPKLQAKVMIVALLTLNGMLLHRAVLPALARAGSLLALQPAMRSLTMFAGTVSAVSWFYAALLGVGRPLAWKYSLAELMAAYPLLIIAGYGAMRLLVALARKRSRAETITTSLPDHQ
ncbi:hypothetical protein FXN65_08610 [Metapseudomonas lalkuanensis]|uniref:DUF2214 family protein n=1 Tax=Metapseudomonas lalkuanensis TaxID=2604832 RepID=A0A5J6QI08_9GAMM|nr:hypothetical protein [Pseudomonas lalkuanensis]QEY62127.1 hypothetical protein FXN65_08610 [Pseudomonas lalkuanensis]UCO99913.1 hypothetical protein LF844_08895 [Pseudomonas lalkuanensis]